MKNESGLMPSAAEAGLTSESMLPPVMALFEHLVAGGEGAGAARSAGDKADEDGLVEREGRVNWSTSSIKSMPNGDGGRTARGMKGETAGFEDAEDMLLPFAFEETLCRDVGAGLTPPSLHLWSHPGGVVLGLRDSKLPRAAEAMAALERQGIRTAVRHSGGAAVPLDAGIVNVALVLPKPPGKLDFHDDFRLLASLIAEAVAVSHPQAAAQIRAGEIAGSYCPGDFDLAIGGRKFCGIAQRRQNSAYFVHAFVVVSGSGEERGELIRGFYGAAAGGDESLTYPRVRPEKIAALSELGGPDSAAVFAAGIREALIRRGVVLKPAAVLRQESGYDLQYSSPRVLDAVQVLRERYAR
ncbi:lipoate--protein ligase family protein [Paenibacillus sp. PK3_47]|uniref:lipoate--protein ligase family protein n=1 Tax=Paenibacillus sp. PK3_47 TaxID=2072642 RepID=UPI00201D6138|nr:lipoate--protein ligase family protein [Paenibacillus sp. PK3_47]